MLKPFCILAEKLIRSSEGSGWTLFLDDCRLLVGGCNGDVSVWDWEGRNILSSLQLGESFVSGINLHPEGNMLATCGKDGVRVWEFHTGREIFHLDYHRNHYVYEVCFTPDGNYLFTAGADGTVRKCDVRTGKKAGKLKKVGNAIYALAVSRDKTMVGALHREGGLVWDYESMEDILKFKGTYYHGGEGQTDLLFSDKGHKLWVTFRKEPGLRVWDLQKGSLEPIVKMETESPAFGITMSQDEAIVALALQNEILLLNGQNYKQIKKWSVPTGSLSYRGAIGRLSLSPNGKILCSTDCNSGVWLWDIASEKLLNPSSGHSYGIRKVALSEDGKMAATGGEDGNLIIWDVEKGEKIQSLSIRERFFKLVFLGNKLLFENDTAKRVLDLSSYKMKAANKTQSKFLENMDKLHFPEIRQAHDRLANVALWEKNIIVSIAGDKTIRFWDRGKKQEILCLQEPKMVDISPLAICPINKIIAFSGKNGQLIIYQFTDSDKPSLKKRYKIFAHEKEITDIAISKDGRKLAVVSLWQCQTKIYQLKEKR